MRKGLKTHPNTIIRFCDAEIHQINPLEFQKKNFVKQRLIQKVENHWFNKLKT